MDDRFQLGPSADPCLLLRDNEDIDYLDNLISVNVDRIEHYSGLEPF